MGLRRAGKLPAANFEDRGPALKSWLRAVRLHQWAKNVLIFVPLLLAHAWSAATVGGGVVAFFSFGLCASATYIINDLLDLEADRKHPRKRRRPFAAGDLSAIAGVSAVVVMMAASFALALMVPKVILALPGAHGVLLPHKFLEWLLLYTATTLTYSLYLKRMLLLDVFVLSGLYTVRILAGSAATTVPISEWLGGFSVFFFLSLAFVKRFSELEALRERGGLAPAGRGYHIGDLEQLRALGTGSMFAAVLVTTLYISNPQTSLLYATCEAVMAGSSGTAAVAEPGVDAGKPRRNARRSGGVGDYVEEEFAIGGGDGAGGVVGAVARAKHVRAQIDYGFERRTDRFLSVVAGCRVCRGGGGGARATGCSGL